MMNVEVYRNVFSRIRTEAAKVLLGQDEIVVHTILAILAGGHVLLEGVPGVGKTLLVRTLGLLLGAAHSRIQFTPDLMPSDVTGGNVFHQKEDRFVFQPGPVFTQLLLADEINRAPAKTQSSLLEAMQELSVTSDGVTRTLPEPFFVIATQNPIESQGTYPLPEAQLDRFLVKLHVRHPALDVEEMIIRHHVHGFQASRLAQAGVSQVTSVPELLAMRQLVASIRVDEGIVKYIADIVTRSRRHPSVYLGSSPRGSIGLLALARAMAASEGRDFVIPDDVKLAAPAVLRHRLLLHPDAEIEGVSADDCVQQILREAIVPRTAA